MCIFLFSLNFEHNLEDYTWDCKCILMQAWLHLQVPKDVPMYAGSGGTGGLQRCGAGTGHSLLFPKTFAQKSVICKVPSQLIKYILLMSKCM